MVLNISPAHLLQKNVLAVLSSAIWSQIANKHWSMAPGVNKGHDWPIWYHSVHLGPTPGAFWGICLSLQIVPKFVFVFRHVRVQFLCVAFVIGHRCLFTSCDFMEHSRPENRCSVKVTRWAHYPPSSMAGDYRIQDTTYRIQAYEDVDARMQDWRLRRMWMQGCKIEGYEG